MKIIPSLNGLRALSVVLVILHHLELYYRYGGQPVPEWWLMFYQGDLGVNIFFIISGFLITSLLLAEEKKRNTISIKLFYFRRTFRIFPAYYFLLAVYFVLQLLRIIHIEPLSWLSALTYTKNIFYGEWYLSHAWSLSLEEQFYLLWPLLFKYGKKIRIKFTLILLLLMPLLKLLSYRYKYPWLGNSSNLLRIDAPLWGCLLAFYYEPLSLFFKQLIHRFQWVVALPFLFIFFSYYFTQFNMAYQWHLGLLVVAFTNQNGMFTYMAISAILLISIHYRSSYWYKFLNWWPVNYTGKLSYSIYLWQQLFIGTGFAIAHPPLNLVCILLMALLSYHLIEKPFLQWRDGLEALYKAKMNRRY